MTLNILSNAYGHLMDKILIVSNLLRIGGAEKLIYEIVCFAKQQNIEPVILILDNEQEEHYDAIYRELNIGVTRTQIKDIRNLRAPLKMFKSIFWRIKLRYFAERFYKSVHVVGLYNVNKIYEGLPHQHRFFWNVNNVVQFFDRTYPYSADFFSDKNDTIVCINKYQITELNSQYGDFLKSKLSLFKLFTGAHDTN